MTSPTAKHNKKSPGRQPGRTTGRGDLTSNYDVSITQIPSPDNTDLSAQLAQAALAYEQAAPQEAGDLFIAWLRLFAEANGLDCPEVAR